MYLAERMVLVRQSDADARERYQRPRRDIASRCCGRVR